MRRMNSPKDHAEWVQQFLVSAETLPEEQIEHSSYLQFGPRSSKFHGKWESYEDARMPDDYDR